MKAIQFAIASIVDSNTGFGLPIGSSQIDYAAAEADSRRIRSRKFVNYLQRIRSGITAARYVLRKRRELKRGLRQLSNLNDRLLDDVGFTRGDIIAAQSGLLDQAQLERLRIGNRDKKRIPQSRVFTADRHSNLRDAANEAVFAKARCA